MKDSFLVNEFTKNQFSFLHNTAYELTSQKELLWSSNNLCEMTVNVVEMLLSFDELFDMQYISFLLLKRIFFNFPKFVIFIEDLLVKVLFNLCHYKDKVKIYLYRMKRIILMKTKHLWSTCWKVKRSMIL